MYKIYNRGLRTPKLQSSLGEREVVLYASSLAREVQVNPARVDHSHMFLMSYFIDLYHLVLYFGKGDP